MIISMLQHKGGTGKTTSCINLGTAFAKAGKKVLLVDLDPQASLTRSFGVKEEDHEDSNIYHLFIEGSTPTPVNVSENLDLLPSHLDLAEVELRISQEIGRESLLKESLLKLTEYDLVFIDCSPFLGLLNINALNASNKVLIPLQAEYLSMHGLSKLFNIIEKVKSKLNHELEIGGVFVTRYDKRKVLNRQVFETLEKSFPNELLRTVIRENIALAEAPAKGVSVFDYDPECNGATDYSELAQEITEKLKV
jgi:chromosome partitioning protein